MSTQLIDLEIPFLPLPGETNQEESAAFVQEVAKETWIAQSLFGYAILHYEDVIAILRDKRWHNVAGLVTQMAGIDIPELETVQRESILTAEGNVHTRLRRLVAPAFSPRSADKLRPFMREGINDLVDKVCIAGHADAVTDICEPYPIPIICELLGAPKSDWQLFSVWATDILRVFNFNLTIDLPKIIKAQQELDSYTRQLIADRRNKPADDLITHLIAAEEEGDHLSNDELVMMVNAVIIGGTDTTRNQLGLALALFAQYPSQWQKLKEEPHLTTQAVEEVLRYSGAVRATGRFASEDIVYKDVLFPAGTIVLPALAIANRDQSVFSSPNDFNIDREFTSQPHLAFGSGIHYCLGASLARAELQEAFTTLAARLKNLSITGPVTYKRITSGIFGPESLPIAFVPHPQSTTGQ